MKNIKKFGRIFTAFFIVSVFLTLGCVQQPGNPGTTPTTTVEATTTETPATPTEVQSTAPQVTIPAATPTRETNTEKIATTTMTATAIPTTAQNTAKTVQVSISGFAFHPSMVNINKGDTVVWTNMDTAPHTVTSDSGGELSSSTLSQGDTYSHTFNSTGAFAYHCSIHTSMKADVNVK